ncbi:MAG: response regulator [Campylobacterota bacterium]|nr:response regulator [Campylobacterota bacterium]
MKILIVDDAKETRETLNNIIKVKVDPSYEIAEAEDGLEALGVVESFTPDIVLTDILMPKMDGIRFTALLKSQPETKHIFVAAITGLSGEDEIKKIYASGVDFYIAKPFQLDDIVARLKVITSLINKATPTSILKPSVIYNCFNDEKVKRYFVTFSIAKEDDIFLLFDYFSHQDVTYNSLLLKDFMVALVKAYRKMDTDNKVFDLILEESDSYIYITVQNGFFIETMESLVKNNSTLFQYAKTDKAFSFRIDVVSFIDSGKKTIKAEQKLQAVELLSATELMIIVSDDILDYVNELNYALQEYKSVCESNDRYNLSLYETLMKLFEQYTRLFAKVPEFDKISIALESVMIIIQNNKTKTFDTLKNGQMITNIEDLNLNIESWIKNVIINQSSHNVHEDDHKIMSSCRLIEADFS